MAKRFGKTRFATYVIGDDRAPILTSARPDEDPVQNPDPGGPGGADPDGNDIGTPTGGGLVTTTLPNITRKTHSQNIFVAKGASVSITYVADGPCTMLPKWGYEDMTVSYTDNGREMTLSWTCPANEPSDSTPVGVEVFVYGGDNETDYSNSYFVLWDILHVGKTSSDLLGFDTTLSLRQNIARIVSSNATLVIPKGVYTGDDDELSLRDNQRAFSSSPPNGSFAESGSGVNKTYTVTENVVIMGETPLGAELDRQGRSGGVNINGNIPEYSGYNVGGSTQATAIKLKSFLLVNSGRGGIGITKGENCAIDGCENLQDMRYRELNDFWTGDGAAVFELASINCDMQYTGAIANERLLNLFAFTQSNPSRRCRITKSLSTQACVQLFNESICQDYSCYGAFNCEFTNVIACDDLFFVAGMIRYSGTRGPNPNFSFINTNGANRATTLTRCMNFNTVKSFFDNNTTENDPSYKSVISHCITTNKLAGRHGTTFPAIFRDEIDVDHFCMGHYETFNQNSAFFDIGNENYTNIMIVNPGWDYGQTDSIMGGNSSPNMSNIGVVNPPPNINEYITSLATYVAFATAEEAGVKYWTRAEQGSPAEVNDLMPVDFWCATGRYGKYVDDADTTVYNGQSGNPYVNWLQRSPWYEKQQARQRYDYTGPGSVNFKGDVGVNEPGVHPVDYFHRKGTSPLNPINCPYIEDIYAKVVGTEVRLWWRPICPKYRTTITALDIYVDNVLVAANQDKRYTYFSLDSLSSGTRKIWIVCKDETYGDSGHSRIVEVTIP